MNEIDPYLEPQAPARVVGGTSWRGCAWSGGHLRPATALHS